MIMIEGTALKVAVVLRSENQREKNALFFDTIISTKNLVYIAFLYKNVLCESKF